MKKFNVFQLIDLDRTIFDTSKFAKAITDEVNIEQPGLGTKLDEQFEAAYEKEETFFLPRYLRQEKGDAWFEVLVDRVVEKHGGDSFLIPGTRELLTFADTISNVTPAWGILTYGDKVDQRIKMRLIGLANAPVYFTRTPDKGEILQTWKTDDGRFQLPLEFGDMAVDILTLEDDKLRAFHNFPDGAIGLWISAPGKKYHIVPADIDESIIPVRDLFDSIEKLTSYFEKL
ncbi:MAG: hypothetical protein ACOH18_04760 [Candidatus Saccharimonadaceae bacterium]